MEKDAISMKEFFKLLEHYEATIPEELIAHYLKRSGVDSKDPMMMKLVALAAHKFLSDITGDALQYQRLRLDKNSAPNVLTMQDLTASLGDYGIHLCKPEYFCDTAQAGTAEISTEVEDKT